MTDLQQTLPVDNNQIVAALQADPHVGIAIVSQSGRVVYANNRATWLYLRTRPEEIRGRTLGELFPQVWVEERFRLFRYVAEKGEPVVFRHIRRGTQILSTVWPIDAAAAPNGERAAVAPDEPHFLAIMAESIAAPDEVPFEVVESKVVDLADLDPLSPRELEILALVGQGLRAQQIAEVLSRSRKTVDKHRDAIVQKLRVASRADLVRIAQRAGLKVADASSVRTREPIQKAG